MSRRDEVPRCQTCRHWEQHDDLPAGLCSQIRDDGGYPAWPPKPEIRSGPEDGFAYLWVPASFGCTEYQPTEEPK